MLFVTFEGIDACGKTTQIDKLYEKLCGEGYEVIVTKQPGGSKIGQQIRKILLDPENKELVSNAELLLYMADRVQHIQEIILPALAQNKIVLCDRYHDATVAYQGAGRQLDLTWLATLERDVVRTPDLTFWFDLSLEESQRRLQHRNRTQGLENCRIEREKSDFFERVVRGYRELYQKNPERMQRIDAEGDIASIHQKVVNILMRRLNSSATG
ncbi:MAG: dTMP kinase [SAR324 cluster bacterium]|uniref:Thymidylate kinase n=1 Tax=SAR324 cluster bacterium TaxID=2024889 RepID=A0A2A4T8I0_9DELT|nr:MAG: dTMP kinase [SAR324 cluster bacterium]